VVGRAAPYPVPVLPVPVVRCRLAHVQRHVQPHVRPQDIDEHLHGGPGRAYRGARVLGMRSAVGQRVSAAGDDGEWRVHVRTAVHNGRPVAELRQ